VAHSSGARAATKSAAASPALRRRLAEESNLPSRPNSGTTTTPQSTLTLIDPFEVPASRQALFIHTWRQASVVLIATGVVQDASLYRSVVPDAEFRFVEVGRIPSADAWQQALASATFAGPQTAFVAHPGLYELMRRDSELEAEPALVLINPFEVPAGQDGLFLSAWETVREAVAREPGYRGTRLYRSAGLHADFRFVECAQWASAEAYRHGRRRPRVDAALAAVPYRGHAALYKRHEP
jgi:heme-degrading monooxygenase HmoA